MIHFFYLAASRPSFAYVLKYRIFDSSRILKIENMSWSLSKVATSETCTMRDEREPATGQK
jgi:hypothetical protein